MKTILFMCYGNVARSQMAEGYFNNFSKQDTAISAGVSPLTPTQYDHPTPEATKVMKEEGIDISQQRVKTITEKMVREADEIWVLTNKNDCPNFVLESKKTNYHEVEDPFGKSLDKYREVRNEIKNIVKRAS